MIIFLYLQKSGDDSLDPQWPFEALHGFFPQPVVGPLCRDRSAGSNLPLAPDPQNTRVAQVDPTLTVKRVQALDDVVRFAGPRQAPFVC